MVPRRIEVLVTSGNVTLDFTQAVISQPSVQIEASVNSGSLTLVTKPGILVDADEVAIRSGSVRIRAPRGPDVPVARCGSTCPARSAAGSITAQAAAPYVLAVAAATTQALSACPVIRYAAPRRDQCPPCRPAARSSRQAGEEPAAPRRPLGREQPE